MLGSSNKTAGGGARFFDLAVAVRQRYCSGSSDDTAETEMAGGELELSAAVDR